MFARSFSYGLQALSRHPGWVALLYGVGLAVAFVLALPIYSAVQDTVGPSGFGPDLYRQFDLVVWADVIDSVGAVLSALGGQLLWMVPLYAVWRVGAQVGLLHALRDGGVGRSFWEGIGRFTGRGMLMALLFLIPQGCVTVLAVVGIGFVAGLGGEVAIFWGAFVVIPALLIATFAVLDLMLDYALAALVIGRHKPLKALGKGLTFPFKHGVASWLYLAWFALAAICTLAPTQLEFALHGVWGLFLVQQVFLLLRAAVTVGWMGSTAYVFETVHYAAQPLIAEEDLEMEGQVVEGPIVEGPAGEMLG